jgi:hypothetical protein
MLRRDLAIGRSGEGVVCSHNVGVIVPIVGEYTSVSRNLAKENRLEQKNSQEGEMVEAFENVLSSIIHFLWRSFGITDFTS